MVGGGGQLLSATWGLLILLLVLLLVLLLGSCREQKSGTSEKALSTGSNRANKASKPNPGAGRPRRSARGAKPRIPSSPSVSVFTIPQKRVALKIKEINGGETGRPASVGGVTGEQTSREHQGGAAAAHQGTAAASHPLAHSAPLSCAPATRRSRSRGRAHPGRSRRLHQAAQPTPGRGAELSIALATRQLRRLAGPGDEQDFVSSVNTPETYAPTTIRQKVLPQSPRTLTIRTRIP